MKRRVFLVTLVFFLVFFFFFSRRSTQSSDDEAMMMMMMMGHERERDVLEGLGFMSLCKIFRVLTAFFVCVF